jgi:FkbM family methyltransferase
VSVTSKARRLRSLLASGRALRPETWRLLLGLQRSAVAQVEGVAIEYDLSSVIGRDLLFEGRFEEPEIAFFQLRLKKLARPLVLDIGANIGVHTLRWAAEGARVYSFEPSPQTRARLERNVERNGLGQAVTVSPLALADTPGRARFYQCRDSAFSSLLDTGRQAVVESFEVEVSTVDAFAESHPLDGLALVKIDVEGVEQQVIDGARRTLEALRPDLFVEIYGGQGSNADPERTVASICAIGYRPFVLVDGEAVPFERHHDEHYNYFFTR